MNRYAIAICFAILGLGIVFLPIFASVIWLPFTSGAMPTESMAPAIHVGDSIFINRMVSFSDIAVGDVIMFKGKPLPIAHRVIAHDGFEITTKGDFNNHTDGPITKDQYLGRVDFIIETHMLGPYLGVVAAVILSVSGLFCLPASIILCVGYRKHRQA